MNSATLEFAQTGAGTFAGEISGSGDVVKSGAGALTLTGSNTYTGGTTISAGRLIAGPAALPGNVVNNATLEFAQSSSGSYAGVISGSGNVFKTGAGSLTLTGLNTYAGTTTISEGSVFGSTASLPGPIVNNATLIFAQSVDGTFANAISDGCQSSGRRGNADADGREHLYGDHDGRGRQADRRASRAERRRRQQRHAGVRPELERPLQRRGFRKRGCREVRDRLSAASQARTPTPERRPSPGVRFSERPQACLARSPTTAGYSLRKALTASSRS